jgi:hypothetical protein
MQDHVAPVETSDRLSPGEIDSGRGRQKDWNLSGIRHRRDCSHTPCHCNHRRDAKTHRTGGPAVQRSRKSHGRDASSSASTPTGTTLTIPFCSLLHCTLLKTFLSLGVVVTLWFYFCLWIESAGHLTPKQPHVYQYQKDGWMKLTRWYNLLAMLWMCQFVIGCQHMVLAGAISDWYFNRYQIL